MDGGAPVSECEIMVQTHNVEDSIAYRGKDTECTVTSLSPGHSYTFLLRANNRVGVSHSSHFNMVFSLVECFIIDVD